MTTAHLPSKILIGKAFNRPASKSANPYQERNSKILNSENDKNVDFGEELENKIKEKREAENDKFYPDLSQFLQELDDKINEGNAISARCNKKIEEAKATHSFLTTSSGVYQPGGAFYHLVPWSTGDKNDNQVVSKLDLSPSYDQVVNSDLPSYDQAVSMSTILSREVKSNRLYPDLSQLQKELEDSETKATTVEKQHYTTHDRNEFKSKNLFSPLKKIYDLGVNSFNTIKDKVINVSTSVLSSKITKAFNFVNNKIFTFLGINSEEIEQVENISDDQLVKKFMNTSENKLNEIFEKITYEKLADIINNISFEQADKLINYILPEHFEKVKDLISPNRLNKLYDHNADGLTLDELTEQQLKKLSDLNISSEKLKDIVILAGEEKLVKNIIKNSTNIPSKNLEVIFSNISAKGSIEILNSLDTDDSSIELSGIAAEAA